MEWRQFVMNLESLDPESVESALVDMGAMAVTFSDAADDPVLEPAPGETPLWRESRVTALFDESVELTGLADRICQILAVDALPAHHLVTLPDRDWEREWLRDFRPMRFGDRLWVVPSGTDRPGGSVVVVDLDLGLAFGTGTHATTALCLEWLDGIDLDGASVLDFGCGSGILGIAALKLGAGHVTAVDIDLQAVSATRQNADRNDVGEHLETGTDFDGGSGPFDIVVANILANTLIELAGSIVAAAKPGGQMALSGILAGQVDEVRAAYADDVEFAPTVFHEEWALVSGTRKQT